MPQKYQKQTKPHSNALDCALETEIHVAVSPSNMAMRNQVGIPPSPSKFTMWMYYAFACQPSYGIPSFGSASYTRITKILLSCSCPEIFYAMQFT